MKTSYKQQVQASRLIGEFVGYLQGIICWDIPEELKEKLRAKVEELEKVEIIEPKEQQEPDGYKVGDFFYMSDEFVDANNHAIESKLPLQHFFLSPQPLKFPTARQIDKYSRTYYGNDYDGIERMNGFNFGANWAIKQMKGESK